MAVFPNFIRASKREPVSVIQPLISIAQIFFKSSEKTLDK